jgi:hypothetical protein
MDTVAKFAAPLIVFLLTLASGLWLSRAGKPLNGILFTAHKLIALAAVIITVLRTYNALRSIESAAIFVALIILIGLCVVALFVTGALMSLNKPGYSALRTIHNIAPFVAVIAGGAALYLLGGTA